MFDDVVRPRFARVAAPASRVLARAGVTPSQVTWAGFLLALAAAGVVAAGHPALGLALWLPSRVADGLDGVLARATDQQTAFGAYLDITLDMAAYCAMVVGFALLHPAYHTLWIAVLAGYVLNITTTLALAAAAAESHKVLATGNRTFQFTRGLAEAGEASVVYVLWALLPDAVVLVGWAWCALLAATVVQRTWLAWHGLPRNERRR
jgi:phosphatidylglycerophosphate synthase